MPRITNRRVPTRDVILREASQLFAERGYHGTSTRDIASAVGIRQPSLFHHFASKPKIMQTLQELDLGPAVERLENARTAKARPAAQLYYFLYMEVLRYLDSSLNFTGTTSAAVLRDPQFFKARDEYKHVQSLQSEIIANGIDAGELVTIDADLASRVIDWVIEGVLIDATRNSDVSAPVFAELLASFVIRSLLADVDELAAVRSEAMALAGTANGTDV